MAIEIRSANFLPESVVFLVWFWFLGSNWVLGYGRGSSEQESRIYTLIINGINDASLH